MKKLILFFVCISCCIALNAKLVFDCVKINDVDKTCYVTMHGKNYVGKVTIPETVEIENREDAYTVIGVGSFRDCINITEIVLPRTIKAIGNSAFYGCTSLSKIEIPYGVEIIGDQAFEKSGIEEIRIPDSVKELGIWAFYLCPKLKNVYIGNGVKELKELIFGECTSIEKVVVGSGITEVSQHCFNGSSLSTLVLMSNNVPLPKSILSINKIYVPNPEYYNEIALEDSNIRPIAKLSVQTPTVYTGLMPKIIIDTELEGFDMVIPQENLATCAGCHSDSVKIAISYKDWESIIKLPCTYSIEKAPLTIVANNTSKYYREEDPAFTFTCIGLVNNETNEVFEKQPIISTTSSTESDAGTYSIFVSGAEAKNYDITYEKGTLTILKAAQTITWENEFFEANVGNMVELSAISTSGLDVKFKSLDMSTAIVTISNGKSYIYPIKEGSVVISAYQDGDKNYEIADEVYKIFTINPSTDIKTIKDINECIVYDINGNITDMHHKGLKIIKDKFGKTQKIF